MAQSDEKIARDTVVAWLSSSPVAITSANPEKTGEAMARFGASHPQGRSDHHASAGSGTNGDELPRFEVT